MPPARTITFHSVPDVGSVDELFAIGHAMETEAARRYHELARRMEKDGEPALAALFRRLEAEEQTHAEGVAIWAGREGRDTTTPITFAWDPPEAASDEDIEDAGGPVTTPWKAWAMAVRNEERAFAFYVNLAARSADPDIQRYAEGMAREELSHVALLRLERRRAWREQKAEADLDSRRIDPGDLEAIMRERESAAAARHVAQARLLDRRSEKAIAELLNDLAERAARIAPGTSTAASNETPDGTAREILKHETRSLEAGFDIAMSVVERTSDEDLLCIAQDWAHTILERLALLRDRLARIDHAGISGAMNGRES